MSVAPEAHTILIVEDNVALRHLVGVALRTKGFAVLEASNPFHAAEIVGSKLFSIDLLVADVEMPNMSGDEFAKELRSMQPSLKIIFATGLLPEAGSGFSTVSHEAYLPKPYSAEDMVEAVRSALASSTGVIAHTA